MRLWKKVSSLILAVALCFCLLPVQAADAGGDQGSPGIDPVFHSFKSLPLTLQSNQVGISVNTTRTDAYSGDVISFEVVMDPVQNLGTLQLVLDIPEGLSYVPDSACVPDDLKTTLGFDELAFTELSLMLNGYASAGNYSAETETLLLTFDCKADDTITAQATVDVSLTNLEFYSIGEDEEDWLDLTDSFEVIPAPLTLHPGTHTHSYTGTVTTPASCTTAGIKTYVCACGERYTEDVPALGHTWDDGVITTEPTATTEGVKTFTCTVCHETKTETVPKIEEIPEDAAKLVIDNAVGIIGETFTVDVKLVNNPGFIGMNFYIECSDGLTLEKVENKVPALQVTSDRTVVFDAGSDYAQDGTLVTLTFSVSDDADVGTGWINVVMLEAFNASNEDVTIYTVRASIQITDCVFGDANGDGVVNTRDIVLIRQYVAAKDPYTGISTVAVYAGADANGDGQINTRDVVLVRQYVAAKDPITGESSVVLGPNS